MGGGSSLCVVRARALSQRGSGAIGSKVVQRVSGGCVCVKEGQECGVGTSRGTRRAVQQCARGRRTSTAAAPLRRDPRSCRERKQKPPLLASTTSHSGSDFHHHAIPSLLRIARLVPSKGARVSLSKIASSRARFIVIRAIVDRSPHRAPIVSPSPALPAIREVCWERRG